MRWISWVYTCDAESFRLLYWFKAAVGRACNVWRRSKSLSWISVRRTLRTVWQNSWRRSWMTPASRWGYCWVNASSTCPRRSPCHCTNISSESCSVHFAVLSVKLSDTYSESRWQCQKWLYNIYRCSSYGKGRFFLATLIYKYFVWIMWVIPINTIYIT